ncbi:MAG: bifunctional phosphopantothenoylcysteine decarboxylase/phosphopantothenate--cysteine ligase CoaBC, partial [Megasphaera micronuciformis]|nr:bifunctional phosphopantothenoylcysteine decarboxylase/phosphopantothenate--cysteine ligase CoaBC [Megasphaera micronuciformis]
MSLRDKHVLLIISGGIAAYKTAIIASTLRKQGAQVKCVMTKHATEFITPLTLREISDNPVAVSMFADVPEFHVEHIALAEWAHVVLVAPATANIIGKAANGIADDMATTVLMATTAPVMVCPAMNTNMWNNKIVQRNVQILKDCGYTIMQPDSGVLACGTVGAGRLPAPERIIEALEYVADERKELCGQKVIVTAGGTREALDPVRYIGNHSSGRMGFAIARAAAKCGADVTLVAAPTDLVTPFKVNRVDVMTTGEMKEAVDRLYDDANIVIKAAAVADYRPAVRAQQKIKKNDDKLTLNLVKNDDILFSLGQRKGNRILVGFAAEPTDVIKYGKGKVAKKILDM